MAGTATAEGTVVPFDPFELKDVVSGSIRDPYPRMQELRRQSPVHIGEIDLGEPAMSRPGLWIRIGRRRSPYSASTRWSRCCGTTRPSRPRSTRA